MRRTAAFLTACLLLLLAACGGQRESVQETENPSVTADIRRTGGFWRESREVIRNCSRFSVGTNTVKSGWITARRS